MRPTVLVLPLLLLAPTARQQQATDPLESRTKGRPNAPVTVYEMADFQCPACRMFAVTVLPSLDTEYVQTGKVRWIFINLPLTSIHANAMAAAEVAMCAARQGRARFWATHDLFYRHQDEWAPLAQPESTLVAFAHQAGADRAKLQACLKAGDVQQEVALDAQRAARTGAHSTPSFYIEGGLLQGAPPSPGPMRQILDSIYTARTRR